MIADVEPLYLQHLTDADRRLIAMVSRRGTPLAALGDPALEEAVFGQGGAEGVRVAMSPFLCFAVAVHGTRSYLDTATYVEERWAPRRRIPVFDVGPLPRLSRGPGTSAVPGRAARFIHPCDERGHVAEDPTGLAAQAFQRARPGALGRAPRGGAARGAAPASTAASGTWRCS